MRRRAIVGLFALVAACTPSALRPLPPPPDVPGSTTSTAPTNFEGVDLKSVPGATTTTVVLGPGKANLSGNVTGPDGPVAGAVVHIERLVGGGTATADVATLPDGTWAQPAVLGGRYRVRAWRAPDLALTKPEVFFLGGSETKALALKLNRYSGPAITYSIAPDPPAVGQPATLVVQVSERTVDQRGIVRAQPQPGVPVELFGSGDWRVESANPVLTDGAGDAHWVVRCRSAGKQPLSVQVADASSHPIDLAECVVAPTPEPTSTTAPPPSSTSSTTSTTSRGGTSTTSTTRRPV